MLPWKTVAKRWRAQCLEERKMAQDTMDAQRKRLALLQAEHSAMVAVLSVARNFYPHEIVDITGYNKIAHLVE